MIPYLNCLTPDDSGITVELFNNISQIPYLDEKKQVPIHQHKFYEMVFIQSGSCRHFYKNETTPLILGFWLLRISPIPTSSGNLSPSITASFIRIFFRNIPQNLFRSFPIPDCRNWRL